MTETARLSASDIEGYRRDGLVVAPQPLPAPLLTRVRASLERLLETRADLPPESLICPHIPAGGAHDAAAAAQWFEYCTLPQILDQVEQLIGPDIVLWGSQVFCKPARVGKEIPWHQDGQYWPIRPLATCSAWIALDDVDAANGCMRYIPGTHAAGSVYAHRVTDRQDVVLNEEVDPTEFDAASARDDVLRAGQYSLHDVFLIHGSAVNRSPRRRAGFVVRYMPATSLFVRSTDWQRTQSGVSFNLSRRPIWLVRGSDRAGNDFALGHGEDYHLAPRESDDR
jgi:hypothetical protein